MPAPLTNTAFRQKLNALVADGLFSPADAAALTSGAALTAAEREIARTTLEDHHFYDEATQDAILAQLGLTLQDLGPAAPAPSDAVTAKLKGKLGQLVQSQLYKPYDFKLTDFALGSRAGLELKVKAQLLSPKDPLVAEDKNRQATTQKHAAAGEPVTWAITGGGIYPRIGFGATIPIGAASANIGFNANAALGYSVLAPYAVAPSAALSAAKNLSVDLPFDAARAKALEEGTEITLRGSGTVAANASIGLGYTLAQLGDLISVGATFGSSIGASKSLDLALRLKRLDGNKIFVSVNKVDTTAGSISLGAHAGVDLTLAKHLPDLGGGLLEKGGDLAAEQVEKQVEKWAQLDFRATHSTSASESEITNYVIDLTTPAGRAAYDDLIRLDFRKVDKLADEGDLSVRTAKLSERTRTSGQELNGKFGPITLLRAVSSATETHGVLESSKGDIHFDRVTLTDSYSGIFSNLWEGKRFVERELVATQKDAEVEPTYYYHVRHRIEGDDFTSSRDVRRFMDFADFLGALEPDTRALVSSPKLLESFGATDRSIDVYLTHAGLAKVASASPEALMNAYAAAYEKLDRPTEGFKPFGIDNAWKTTPWLKTSDPAYPAVMQLLEQGPSGGTGGGEGGGTTNDSTYWSYTARSLASDSAAYKASLALVKLVQETKGLPGAAERIHHLAEQDKKLGLDFWNALAALSIVAGPAEVMVNELSIKDKDHGKELVLTREGAIQDPRSEIMARLGLAA